MGHDADELLPIERAATVGVEGRERVAVLLAPHLVDLGGGFDLRHLLGGKAERSSHLPVALELRLRLRRLHALLPPLRRLRRLQLRSALRLKALPRLAVALLLRGVRRGALRLDETLRRRRHRRRLLLPLRPQQPRARLRRLVLCRR